MTSLRGDLKDINQEFGSIKSKYFTLTGTIAAGELVVEHNLGRYPVVQVIDGGEVIQDGTELTITHDSVNQVTLTFATVTGEVTVVCAI